MPLDSAVPQEALIIGRQIGGRTIDVTSGQWRTLFPSDTLRIDGRVPVESSAKFLLQMRMTPTRELVAVAFSPEPGTDGTGFKVLSDFLINKGCVFELFFNFCSMLIYSISDVMAWCSHGVRSRRIITQGRSCT